MRRLQRSPGGVDQERAHSENVAGNTFDGHFIGLIVGCNLSGTQFPHLVRTGDYPQGSVFGVCGIEMNPETHHLFQQRERRLNMRDSVLDGPGAVSFAIDSFRDCDGEILMPCHRPVGGGSFVEEKRADRDQVRRGETRPKSMAVQKCPDSFALFQKVPEIRGIFLILNESDCFL